MSAHNNPEFIRAIPKTDLHVHLDGSLRLRTLIDLAREHRITLPSYEEAGLRELVFKEKYNDLVEYLHGFKYTCALMQQPEALERVAYELAVDSYAEGVRYIEPRFAPQLHITEEMEMVGVLQAVEEGLKRAAREYNNTPGVQSGDEPPYGYGIIVCAMRMFTAGFSSYYRKIMDVHRFSPERATFGLASMELARAAVSIRDDYGVSIVGFDLAGQEDGYPAHDHVEAFSYAHRNFLHKTVHAGEAYGAESIFEAITDLHANRIGHGYYLFDADRIKADAIEDREEYIRALAEYIADQRVTIEICLTSNLQTNPTLESLANHPMRQMLESRISTTLCTDNRLVSNTTVGREMQQAIEHLGLSPRQLKNCVINGFKRSFMPQMYLEKRAYVRQVIDYYERLEKQYGIVEDHL